MRIEFLHVGFDNIIVANRVVAITVPSSAPVKRMVREAGQRGMLIDMTSGRKTKAVIVMDTGHVALAAHDPTTIGRRINARSWLRSEKWRERPTH